MALARRRMLVVRTDRLGETLLTLPALRALREAHASLEIMLMANRRLSALLDGHPDIDRLVPEPILRGPGWIQALRLARCWRRLQVEVIVIANPKKLYHAAAWLAGVPIRVGYDRKWGGLLTHRMPDRKAAGAHHEVEYNVELVRPLGISSGRPVLRLPVPPAVEQDVAARLQALGIDGQSRLVAVHPWTSNARKRWPAERFATVMQGLSRLAGVRVIAIGGDEERARADALLSRLDAPVVNMTGRLSLAELAATLKRCALLISNDSGPVHVAAAVGTPVLAIFGTDDPGSQPARWGPWGTGHVVIQQPLAELTAEQVLRLAHSALAARSGAVS